MKPKEKITVSDLKREAIRLLETNQMPDLPTLLAALAETRAKYRPLILAARRGRK